MSPCPVFPVFLLLLLLRAAGCMPPACAAARSSPRGGVAIGEEVGVEDIEEGDADGINLTSISSMSEMTAGAAINLARGLAADWGSVVFGLDCILEDEPVVDRRNVKSLPSDDMV